LGENQQKNVYTPDLSKSGVDPQNSEYSNAFSSKRQKYRSVELQRLLALKYHCDCTGHTDAEVAASFKTNIST
jgi:hypothetical protein